MSSESAYVGSWGVRWGAKGVVGEVQVPANGLHDEHAGEGDDWGLKIAKNN